MKKVIVIGGGFAGSLVAKKLENEFDVTLIDTKNYFEFTPGVLRSIVEPEHVSRIQVLHSHYLSQAKILIGKVREVNEKFVKINGKKINFDYLVVSSGSTYNAPFKEQDIVIATRADHLKNKYEGLCKAKKIVIIGGGAVGVELAGEILGKYKDKEITLVHSSDKLIERNHRRAGKYAQRYLKRKGVRILFGQRIVSVKGKNCLTDKGDKVEADIVFLCTGIKPNFELLKNFADILNDGNQVVVNDFLQVNGFKNIFAAGDITAIKEEKTAQNAERQGKIVVKNICHLENGGGLETYESKKTPMVISLGKWNGIFDNGKFVWTGFIPGLMKWFVERKEMWKKRKL